jgi:drug/metabolite transporter (DMT)-like permease
LEHFGELAALGTACCWTVTALSFEAAGRRVGSLAVNLIRLVIAFGLLTAFGWLVRGLPLPTDASARAWLWLAVSGIVGFSIGDLCLFQAFVLVGARTAMLVMSLVPPIAAATGWLLLGETLTVVDVAAMMLTVGGVAWVVSERAPTRAVPPADRAEPAPPRRRALGVLLALGGAVGQATGLVLSKVGMGDYDAFAATQIRVIAGIATFGVLFTIVRVWPRVTAALRSRPAMVRTSVGAFCGPFLGVSLSLVAVQHTEAGVAATIMSIVPVLIIAPAVVLFREQVTLRAVLGSVVTVMGVALLFLV